jgi:hypothetical protein
MGIADWFKKQQKKHVDSIESLELPEFAQDHPKIPVPMPQYKKQEEEINITELAKGMQEIYDEVIILRKNQQVIHDLLVAVDEPELTEEEKQFIPEEEIPVYLSLKKDVPKSAEMLLQGHKAEKKK